MFVRIRPQTVKPPFGSVQINWGHPLAHGLVGCWLFNEGAGDRVFDLRSIHTGTLINGPTWTYGRTRIALEFDGLNDYVSIPHNAALTITGPLSISAWVRLDTNTNHVIAHKAVGNGTLNNPYTYRLTSSATITFIRANAASFVAVESTGTVSLSVWHHVQVTINVADVVRHYIDGVLASTPSASIAPTENTEPTLLGKRADDNATTFFDGRMEDVRIYNRELSAIEVFQSYAEPYAFLQVQNPIFYSIPTAAVAGGVVTPRSLGLLGVGT